MAAGRKRLPDGHIWNPQREAEHEFIGPWSKYDQWVDRQDPLYCPIMYAMHELDEAGVEMNEQAAAIATTLARHRVAKSRAEHDARMAAWDEEKQRQQPISAEAIEQHPDPVVYYVRRGQYIKIGTTVQFTIRMTALRPDEVLAVEPGSYDLERERHLQFADSRANGRGEYFFPSQALIEHMLSVRAQHGIPSQSSLSVTDGRSFFAEAAPGA
jgi:hypothetical protein